jgi:hypothetical protein
MRRGKETEMRSKETEKRRLNEVQMDRIEEQRDGMIYAAGLRQMCVPHVAYTAGGTGSLRSLMWVSTDGGRVLHARRLR